MLSFSGPANSHLELTGLLLGNAGEKGRCLGAWEPSPHTSPSPGLSLWDVSSAKGTLPKISRHCSVKMRGTELVSGNAHPPGSQLSWSIWTLLRLLSAPDAVMGMLLPTPRSGWDTRVLQPWPRQHHAEMSALLPSLLPEQVRFINEGILKGLILPLAQFKASLWQEVPHPWPGMPCPGAFL